MKMEAGWQQFNRFISPFRNKGDERGIFPPCKGISIHPLFSDQSPMLACQPAPRNMKMEAGWQQFITLSLPFVKGR
jgi:hypothetical protein